MAAPVVPVQLVSGTHVCCLYVCLASVYPRAASFITATYNPRVHASSAMTGTLCLGRQLLAGKVFYFPISMGTFLSSNYAFNRGHNSLNRAAVGNGSVECRRHAT